LKIKHKKFIFIITKETKTTENALAMTADTFIENSYYAGLNRAVDQYWEDRLQHEYQPKNDFSLRHEAPNKWILFLPEPVSLTEKEIGHFLYEEHDVYCLLLDAQSLLLSCLEPCNDIDDHQHVLRSSDLLIDFMQAQFQLTAARIEAQMAQTKFRLLRQQVERKFYRTGLPGSLAQEPFLQLYTPQRCA
jgi:hypothetical protein